MLDERSAAAWLLLSSSLAISILSGESNSNANYASFPAEENGTCYKRIPYDDAVAESISKGIIKAVPGSLQTGVKTSRGGGWVSVIDCCDGFELDNATGKCETHCEGGCVGGTCTGPNVCSCEDGWRPEAGVCRAICRRRCPRYAYCISPDVCTCKFGYAGDGVEDCRPVCARGCRNGDCVAPRDCRCHPGYMLNETEQCAPICEGGCPHGECAEPGVCTCDTGYVNPPTDLESCVPDCPKTCTNGECFSPGVCTCHSGYSLAANGSCLPQCQRDCVNGYCRAPNECACNPGFAMNYRLDECIKISSSHPTAFNNAADRKKDSSYPVYSGDIQGVIGLNNETATSQTPNTVSNDRSYESQGIPFVNGMNKPHVIHGTPGSYGSYQNSRTHNLQRPISSQGQTPNIRDNNRPYGSYGNDQNQDLQRTFNSQESSTTGRLDQYESSRENNEPYITNRNNPTAGNHQSRFPSRTYFSTENPHRNAYDNSNSRAIYGNDRTQNPQRSSSSQGLFPAVTPEESETLQPNNESHDTYEDNQANIKPQERYPTQRYSPTPTQTSISHDTNSPRGYYGNNQRQNPQRPPTSQGPFPIPTSDQLENPQQNNYENNPTNIRPQGRYRGRLPVQRPDQTERPDENNNPYDVHESNKNLYETTTLDPEYKHIQTQNPLRTSGTSESRPIQTPTRNNYPHEIYTDSHTYKPQEISTSPRSSTSRYPSRESHGNNYPYQTQGINSTARNSINDKSYVQPDISQIPIYSGVDLTYGAGEIFIVPGSDLPFTYQGPPIQTQIVYGPYDFYPSAINIDTANVNNKELSLTHRISVVSDTSSQPGNVDNKKSFEKEMPDIANANRPGPICSMPCLNGECVGPNQCACKRGYKLDTNNPYSNTCVPICHGGCPNGVCTAPNLCLCKFGFIKEYGIKGVQRCIPIV